MTLNRALLLSAISSLAVTSAIPAYAQQEPAATSQEPVDPADDSLDTENEIVVTAQNIRGSVQVAQPPIQVLSETDIAAYGASSIADLVAALAPQTGSGRGRSSGPPVFLVNGMRVSSFREMRSFPPEAIQKVEILPEEVAQKYGFSADQRLINFILKNNYSSRELEGEYSQPGAGGTSTKQVEATYLQIAGPSRFNINAEWNDTSLLTEAERGVAQSVVPGLATDPDPANYRSLVGDSSDLELTGNVTTRLGDAGSSLSVNGTYERSRSLSLSGLNTVTLTDPDDASNSLLRTYGEDDPLARRSRTETVSFGSTLNAPLGDWQLTGTVDASRARSTTEIDRYADSSVLEDAVADGSLAYNGVLPSTVSSGFDTAKTLTDSASSLVTVMGSPLMLPAGDVTLTLDAGYKWNRVQSEDTRNPGVESSLTRGDLSAGFNLGVPITSRDDDFLGAVGDISLNFTAGVDHLSDFGTLTDWTAGINWGITDTLNIQASYITRDAAPGLSQLNSPEVVTLNVPTYDLSRGETVLATVISGGNPNLTKEKQRDVRIGAFWQLPFLSNSSISVEYNRNNSSDVSASFPLLTPAIEAAFADRVQRDAITGQLISIDQRPVTFDSQKSSRLRFGLNLSGPFGKANASAGNANSPFAMIRNATGGGQASGQGNGQGAAPAAGASGPQGGFGGPGGGFNPERFAQFRQQLCADGATPDIALMPEPMKANLLKPDGTIDQEKLNQAKQRICSSDGPQGGFDPARFAEMRQRFCATGNDEVPDLAALPEPVQANLRGADGKLDPEKYAQFKQRVCSSDGPPQGGQGNAQGAGQGGGQGAAFAGPPPGGPPPGGAGGGVGAGGRGGPGGPGGGFRGPGGGGPGGGDGRGRWFMNLNYTLELENEVQIAENLPLLNLLDGDALSGSGVVRHSAQLVGGLFYRGIGMRYTASYSGPSRIDGTGLSGSTDLEFGSLAKLDLRMFADLGQQAKLVEAVPFLKGSRISFGVDNVFDSYRTVTDSNGDVPLRYQRAYMDANGRTFSLEFRKMF
ncbi:hypothetical protein [Altererythrobacter fulvus]|uniref:TonB-dependent receptor plug domain-containing protein n=1 Tax=Caenibius fulvus TaxID=2126012 RepID=UPI0030191F91